MQIVAKAILLFTGIGLLAESMTGIIGICAQCFSNSFSSYKDCLYFIPYFSSLLVISMVFVFGSNKIAKWMSGPTETEVFPNQTKWAATAFRIASVLAGLKLLPSTIFIITLILTGARPFIQQVLVMKTVSLKDFFSSYNNVSLVSELFRAAFCLYLVSGATHLVQYHLNCIKRNKSGELRIQV